MCSWTVKKQKSNNCLSISNISDLILMHFQRKFSLTLRKLTANEEKSNNDKLINEKKESFESTQDILYTWQDREAESMSLKI